MKGKRLVGSKERTDLGIKHNLVKVGGQLLHSKIQAEKVRLLTHMKGMLVLDGAMWPRWAKVRRKVGS